MVCKTCSKKMNNEVVYEVDVELVMGRTHKKFARQMTQSELDGLIGRYLRKYGPPINCISQNDKFMYEYYSRDKIGAVEIFVVFGLVKSKDADAVTTTSAPVVITPPTELKPPPPPAEPENEKIMTLVKAGFLFRS